MSEELGQSQVNDHRSVCVMFHLEDKCCYIFLQNSNSQSLSGIIFYPSSVVKFYVSSKSVQYGHPTTYHDVFRLEVLMDNIFGMEVEQPFTHTDYDGSFISWGQLWKFEI